MDAQEDKVIEDPTIHKAIAAIISKDPTDLTASDRAFLRSRSSYLGRNARKKFADALAEEPTVEEEKEVVTPEDPLEHPAVKEQRALDESQSSDEGEDE